MVAVVDGQLWYVANGGGGGRTAVRLTGAGFSDFFPTIYGGLTFDADTRTLYITDNNRTGTLGSGADDSTSKVIEVTPPAVRSIAAGKV